MDTEKEMGRDTATVQIWTQTKTGTGKRKGTGINIKETYLQCMGDDNGMKSYFYKQWNPMLSMFHKRNRLLEMD